MLLDVSTAFDTVDHGIVIDRVINRFGKIGNALAWIESYLTDRTQFVKLGSERSSNRKLSCGVPRDSVLGPILYNMYTEPLTVYTAPLTDIITKNGMNFHFYHDDTQIYLSFKSKNVGEPLLSRSRVELCIRDVTQWMTANKLMLNHDKTELLILYTPVITHHLN